MPASFASTPEARDRMNNMSNSNRSPARGRNGYRPAIDLTRSA